MAPSQLAQLKAALSTAGLNRQSAPKNNKNKKNKRGGAQEVDRAKNAAKLEEIRRNLNKFDERETKLKHDVGGRKLKGVVGRPSASRSAGLEQRRKTLLPEHHLEGHKGTFNDRRFGESNPSLSLEDRMLERYTRERQRGQGRKGQFNLDDDGGDLFGDEEDGFALGGLTHGGRSVMDLPGDDFDAQGLGSDDEEEGGRGAIDRRTVSRAHFGGFGNEEEDDDDEPERKKTKQEVMSEIIAKSKEYKYERQKEKEMDTNLREELDSDLAELRELLGTSAPVRPAQSLPGPSRSAVPTPAAPVDTDRDYDQYVRSLAFDARAKPKDRTKTEEEVAVEEKERLEAAEARRLRRMRGEDSEDEEDEGRGKKARRKASGRKDGEGGGADDLDDDFMGDVDEDGNVLLGPGLTREDFEKMGEDGDDKEDDEDEEEDDDDDDDDEDDDEEGDDEEGDEDEEEEDEENEDEDESVTSAMEDLDDDEADDDEADDDEDEDASTAQPALLTSSKRKGKARAAAAAEAKKEIPYMFSCPSSVDELEDILEGLQDDALPIVVQRIRALHHPSLAQGNKDKLQQLVGVLLDYVVVLASRPSPPLRLIATLGPHLSALVKLNPLSASTHFIAKLSVMQANLQRGLSRGPARAEAKTFPGAPELSILRLVGTVWSTSDFSHPVVQPAVLLIGQYLSQSRIRRVTDIASGLFLCTLIAQYEQMSKRLVPEVINFVATSICCLVARRKDAAKVSLPTLSVADRDLELPISSVAVPSQPADLVAALSADSEQSKADTLSVAFKLVQTLATLYASNQAFIELFSPVLAVLQGSRVAKLSTEIRTLHDQVTSVLSRQLEFATASRLPLEMQAHKPLAIPSFAPRFEDDFAPGRHYDPDAERSAASKLRAEYKKERKGAIRELRKDNRFLAGERAREQKEKDEAYESKMRRVHGSIGDERAEEKQMEREKRRDKRRRGN